MPNYTLISQPIFEAQSLNDMLEPFKVYGEAYNKLEDKYEKLMTDTEKWREAAMRDPNGEFANQFKAYYNNLSGAANDLMTNGLNPDSRRAGTTLAAQYQSQITPIGEAYENWKKWNDQMATAKLNDPTLEYSDDPNSIPLEQFKAGRTPDIDVASGKHARERVSAISKTIAQTARNVLEGKEDAAALNDMLQAVGGGDYYVFSQDFGVSPQDVLDVLEGRDTGVRNPAINALLNGIVKRAVDAESNTYTDEDGNEYSLFDDRAIQNLTNEAQLGLFDAIGETKNQLTDNWRKKEAVRAANEAKKQQKQFEHEEKMAGLKNTNGLTQLDDGRWVNKKGQETDENGVVKTNPNGSIKTVPEDALIRAAEKKNTQAYNSFSGIKKGGTLQNTFNQQLGSQFNIVGGVVYKGKIAEKNAAKVSPEFVWNDAVYLANTTDSRDLQGIRASQSPLRTVSFWGDDIDFNKIFDIDDIHVLTAAEAYKTFGYEAKGVDVFPDNVTQELNAEVAAKVAAARKQDTTHKDDDQFWKNVERSAFEEAKKERKETLKDASAATAADKINLEEIQKNNPDANLYFVRVPKENKSDLKHASGYVVIAETPTGYAPIPTYQQ